MRLKFKLQQRDFAFHKEKKLSHKNFRWFKPCFLLLWCTPYCYHGVLPVGQSHGHWASCFIRWHLTLGGVRFGETIGRLVKCHHPHHPGWCKIFRAWVKFGTEHMVHCQKFNLMSQFYTFGGLKFWEMQGILLLGCF